MGRNLRTFYVKAREKDGERAKGQWRGRERKRGKKKNLISSETRFSNNFDLILNVRTSNHNKI